jgi:predicted RNA binding protein YcfA (HicA-like mRNA interferase family)
MPRLRVLSGKEVCKILSEHGFVEVRRKGSHIIMQKRLGRTHGHSPCADHEELKIGTLLGIIRQSGLPRELFEVKQ